jgi:hypothetical protein
MKTGPTRGAGVLLSGPDGVGKTAVGLLAYQACLAQRLPVVYLPYASAWVDQAMAGNGAILAWEREAVQGHSDPPC